MARWAAHDAYQDALAALGLEERGLAYDPYSRFSWSTAPPWTPALVAALLPVLPRGSAPTRPAPPHSRIRPTARVRAAGSEPRDEAAGPALHRLHAGAAPAPALSKCTPAADRRPASVGRRRGGGCPRGWKEARAWT